MIASLIISVGSFLDIARNSANIFAERLREYLFLSLSLSHDVPRRVVEFLSLADLFVKRDGLCGPPKSRILLGISRVSLKS